MLSICIPVYNFNVSELVSALHQQIRTLNAPVEIICIDDCSEGSFRFSNSAACYNLCRYVQLDKNIGRAKIRNLFLLYSGFDYMLFLDCDSIVFKKDFIQNYINTINKNKPLVICGGRIYSEHAPERKKILRWKYGISRESLPLEKRQYNPNKSFMTNNFVIKKSVLENIRFDERLTLYGHEDTFFGYSLKKNGIPVTHSDNPVLNGFVEDNKDYIKKTEEGLKNLQKIIEFSGSDNELINDIALLKYHRTLLKWKLLWLVKTGYCILKPLLKNLLVSGWANMSVFNFYKLGYFTTYRNPN
jgi:hypothetical protein